MTRTGMLAAAAIIVCYQLLVPPIVGIADQGDFRRVIGKFGYGPEHRDRNMLYLETKYVRDADNRVLEWEQPSSQYLFVWAALAVNRVVSKDGKLDVRVIGAIYTLAFLAVLGRLLLATQEFRGRAWLWIALTAILTDVGYVAYFNTFFAEPVSLIFFLLLAAESARMIADGGPSRGAVLRWFAWAILFVAAKPVNAIAGIVLGLFGLRFRTAMPRGAPVGAGMVCAVAALMLATTPREMRNANTYNLVFESVLPESRNPAADLQALGLDWRLEDYSRTGAWSPNTIYPELEARGDIGARVGMGKVLRFYLARPTRLWRHIQAMLPVALIFRPEYGNFEPPQPPSRSRAFALWSDFHENVLARAAKWIFFLLAAPAVALAVRWRSRTLALEFYALLGAATLAAFLTAIFGDGQDNVKHLFLFNLLVDAFLISSAAILVSARERSGEEGPRALRDGYQMARENAEPVAAAVVTHQY